MSLTFTVSDAGIVVDATAVVIAGFTGRDRAAVAEHLAELAELGVPTPKSVPSFYVTPGTSAVQQPRLAMVGAETSGEAEAVLVFDGDDAYLTLGSDHTDRAAEAIDIALSKLACPKPLATVVWRLEEVADHADDLLVRSWITEDGVESLYQEGRLGELMDLGDLLDATPFADRPDRFVLFTGTFPALGGIRPAERFRATLEDPVRGRSLSLDYRIDVLHVLRAPG
ncbi:MAG: DUF2848 family protein [bacterium]|nr:DUF2848 family protein [bacterium]